MTWSFGLRWGSPSEDMSGLVNCALPPERRRDAINKKFVYPNPRINPSACPCQWCSLNGIMQRPQKGGQQYVVGYICCGLKGSSECVFLRCISESQPKSQLDRMCASGHEANVLCQLHAHQLGFVVGAICEVRGQGSSAGDSPEREIDRPTNKNATKEKCNVVCGQTQKDTDKDRGKHTI